MTNIHFVRFTQWKQTSYFLIACLLIALTVTHAFYYYKLYSTQQKVKAACAQDPQETNSGQLSLIIQEIDKQELYATFNALLEIMPPSVKIEKLEYNKTGTTITCRAQNHNGMVTMLESCSKNNILKKFALKNSSQEKDGILFVLS